MPTDDEREPFDPNSRTMLYLCATCGKPGNPEQGNVRGRETFAWYHEGCPDDPIRAIPGLRGAVSFALVCLSGHIDAELKQDPDDHWVHRIGLRHHEALKALYDQLGEGE